MKRLAIRAFSLAGGLICSGIIVVRYENIRGGIFKPKPRAEPTDMTGKVAIITGGNAGIGKCTAMALAKMNAQVVIACRNTNAGENVANQIKKETGNNNVDVIHLDLASFQSIRKFVDDFHEKKLPLHVLVNNAGLIDKNEKTVDGLGSIMAVNYFGPFLLTNLLLPDLIDTKGRIVNVSSKLSQTGTIYKDDLDRSSITQKKDGIIGMHNVYSSSKLALVLFTETLSEKLKGRGVTVNALHPGFIATDFSRNMDGSFFYNLAMYLAYKLVAMNSWQGAQTSIYLASSKEVEGVSGKYFEHCKEQKFLNNQTKDSQLKELLWSKSCKITQIPYW